MRLFLFNGFCIILFRIMDIAVCICQVPDPAIAVSVIDGTPALERVAWVMNPYDEYALEEALRFRERFPGSVVAVITITSGSAMEILQKALALGADRAVEVRTDAPLQDCFQTASVLAGALRSLYGSALPQVVFCGRESLDYQHGSVPGMLACMLGMGFSGPVTSFRTDGELLELERETEGGVEYLEARYPIVLSAEKGLNTPRKTGIRQVMEARKKPIETLHADDVPGPLVRSGRFEAVSAKKECRFFSSPEELAGVLQQDGLLHLGRR